MTIIERHITDNFNELFYNNHNNHNNNHNHKIFVDVGAFNGDTIKKALSINPNLRVIAIEPIKSLADEINQRNQNHQNQITVINKAAWSEKKSITFHEYTGWAIGLSTLQPIMTQLRPIGVFTTQILYYPVDTDTLDNILSDLQISKIDYLKIDTEGSEDQVLAGFTKYHSKTRFNIEFHMTNLANIIQRLLEMKGDIEKITLNRDPNIKDHIVGSIIGQFS